MTTARQLGLYAAVAWAIGDVIEIRPLPPEKGRRTWMQVGKGGEHVERMQKENERGAHIYAGIVPRKETGGGEDTDCAEARVIWTDFDKQLDVEAVRARLESAGLPQASMAVCSGHGLHVFWRLDSPIDATVAAKIVRGVSVAVGADTSVANPSRILRLPGFVNHKPPVADCKLLYADPKRTYSRDIFERFIEVEPERVTVPAAPAERSTVLDRAMRYAQHVPAAGQGTRNKEGFRLAAILTNDFALSFTDAYPVMSDWGMRCSPPLGEKEIRALLDNGSKYSKAPSGSKVNTATTVRPTPAKTKVPDKHGRQILLPPRLQDADAASGLVQKFERERVGKGLSVPLPWAGLNLSTKALRPGAVLIVGGPPGYGKSMFSMQIAIELSWASVPWSYLPLEDQRMDFEQRILAYFENDWDILDDKPEYADNRKAAWERHSIMVQEIMRGVTENPRLVVEQNGRKMLPSIHPDDVLEWVQQVSEGSRVVFIDPLAQIDFDEEHQRSWVAEKKFIQALVALARSEDITVVLNVHTIKRPGKSGTLRMTQEDLQGAAELSRLTQTIILIDAHDWQTGTVGKDGFTEDVEHNRTIIVGKARYGAGRGARFAYSLKTPRFDEHGPLVNARG